MFIITLIYLICSYTTGLILINRYTLLTDGLYKISASYLIGTIVSTYLLLISSLLVFSFYDNAIDIGFIITIILMLVFTIHYSKFLYCSDQLTYYNIIIFSIIFVFSWILFSSTLNYDSDEHVLRISRLIWSDYGFHIPLIRSFSLGNNIALEHPLYAHESLRYHFMIDFLAGSLEKTGMPIDFAINLPSSLFWTALIISIYYLGKTIFFNSVFVGLVSSLLFLLNSSLSFLEIIKKYYNGSISGLIKSWWNLKDYVAFGPWDGNIIGAFWNWNIYINQRHLILGFAVVVSLLVPLLKDKLGKEPKNYKNRSYIFYGFICGLLPLWNGHAFICMFGFLGLLFILFPERKPLLLSLIVALIVSLPQILWLQAPSENIQSHFRFNPGYMVPSYIVNFVFVENEVFNRVLIWIASFSKYWFFNIGLSSITIFLSLFMVCKQRIKIFLVFFSVFIIGNLFQFSAEMGANHKFFNLWLILSNTFTAYLLFRLYKIYFASRLIVFVIILFLILSGIVDSMPVKNDFKISYVDYQKDPVANWITNNTEPGDVFLTTNRIYNQVSFTGRKSVQGWPYFAWSAGYNTDMREQLAKRIYGADSRMELCMLLEKNQIDYILLEKSEEAKPEVNLNKVLYHTYLKPIYQYPETNITTKIYSKSGICTQLNK